MNRAKNTPGVSVGDRLVVRAHHLGEPERDAEILAVLGDGGPYRVRWADDGRESIIYPGPDIGVEHFPASHATRRALAGEGS